MMERFLVLIATPLGVLQGAIQLFGPDPFRSQFTVVLGVFLGAICIGVAFDKFLDLVFNVFINKEFRNARDV